MWNIDTMYSKIFFFVIERIVIIWKNSGRLCWNRYRLCCCNAWTRVVKLRSSNGRWLATVCHWGCLRCVYVHHCKFWSQKVTDVKTGKLTFLYWVYRITILMKINDQKCPKSEFFFLFRSEEIFKYSISCR